MTGLKTLWEDAVKEAKEAYKVMEFEWINNNNGSYSIAREEYTSAVIRANELFHKIQQEEKACNK